MRMLKVTIIIVKNNIYLLTIISILKCLTSKNKDIKLTFKSNNKNNKTLKSEHNTAFTNFNNLNILIKVKIISSKKVFTNQKIIRF